MNKKQAKKKALLIASRFIDASIAAGGWVEDVDGQEIYNEDDAQKIQKELDLISQQLFNRYDKTKQRIKSITYNTDSR